MSINFNAFWIAGDNGIVIDPVLLPYADVRRLRIVPVAATQLWAMGVGVEDQLDLIFAGEKAITLPLDPGDSLAWDICEGIGGGVLAYHRNDEGNLLAEQYTGPSKENISRSRDFGVTPRIGRASCVTGPKNTTLVLNSDGTVPSVWVPPVTQTQVKSFRYYVPPKPEGCDNTNPTYQPWKFLTTNGTISSYDYCAKTNRTMTAMEYHNSRLCSIKCVASERLVDEGPLPSDSRFHQWNSEIWTGVYKTATAGGWVIAPAGTHPKSYVDAGYTIEWIDPWRVPSTTTTTLPDGTKVSEPYTAYGQPVRQAEVTAGYWREIRTYTAVDSYVLGNGLGQTRALEPDPNAAKLFRQTNTPFITETGWWKTATWGFSDTNVPIAILHGNGQMRRATNITSIDNVSSGDDGYRLQVMSSASFSGIENAATVVGFNLAKDAVTFTGTKFIAWPINIDGAYSSLDYPGPTVGTIFCGTNFRSANRAVFLCELNDGNGWGYGLVAVRCSAGGALSGVKWAFLDDVRSDEVSPNDWADMIIPTQNTTQAFVLYRDKEHGNAVLGKVDLFSTVYA